MCSPGEKRIVRALLSSLGRREWIPFPTEGGSSDGFIYAFRRYGHSRHHRRVDVIGPSQGANPLGETNRCTTTSNQETESRAQLAEGRRGSDGDRA